MNYGKLKDEMLGTLRDYIIPFWLDRSVDSEYGGYLTCFDEKGKFDGHGIKNVVTQCRMIWGFSSLLPYAKTEDRKRMEEAAKQGVDFLLEKFWDSEFGGVYWLLERNGQVKDPAKLTYGEGFAIYALAQYYLTYHDTRALEYSEKIFDLLQVYVADTENGGYFENIERDWTLSPAGAYAGDRKSLDIHMHLLEAFTVLAKASGKEIHKRKLKEVYGIISEHMVNHEIGYGFNQFDVKFNKIPAIAILRTWNAERESNEKIANPEDTTSYGHNVELSWLADFALKVIGSRTEEDSALLLRLLDHALRHGYDYEHGGIYRDGIADGPALVLDKEWWQNFESMTGFLNGYLLSGNEKYFDAYAKLWDFVKTRFMNYEVGESRQLLDKEGNVIVGNIGNPWKGIYHTGRAFAECISRLEYLQKEAK